MLLSEEGKALGSSRSKKRGHWWGAHHPQHLPQQQRGQERSEKGWWGPQTSWWVHWLLTLRGAGGLYGPSRTKRLSPLGEV